MILVDIPMQTCIGVMDEVEDVEIHVAKPSTMTPSVTVSTTVPCPVGNITHDGLYGSRWDLCGPKDVVVKKLRSIVTAQVALLDKSVKESGPKSAVMSSTILWTPRW